MNVGYKRIIILILLFCLSTQAKALDCMVRSSGLSFPDYDFLSIAPTDASTQLTVQCDQAVPFVVKMSSGLYSAGNFNLRQMQAPQSNTPLLYNIYVDGSYSQIWGDGLAATAYYRGEAGQSLSSIPVYARIPARQAVAPGFYRDLVIITLEW